MDRELPRLLEATGEGCEVEHSGTLMARCECAKSDARREAASVLLGIAAEEEDESVSVDDDCYPWVVGGGRGYG
jgi:hypothetical protein